jgi:peptidoglycan/xylan/chitin deacetylase (PgdA/CDA1 family)
MKMTARNILTYLYANYLLLRGDVHKAIAQLKNGQYILSIYFHDPSKPLFGKCMKWLNEQGIFFIDLNTLHDIAKGNMPFPKGAVVLTVDDGWKTNKTNIVEMAHQQNIPVAIFVTTEPVLVGNGYWWSYVKLANKTGYLNITPEQVKLMENKSRLELIVKLKDRFCVGREAMTVDELQEIEKTGKIIIGSHTVTHPILSRCTDEEVYMEICHSKQQLEDILKHEINGFAYPNGDFSEREIKMVERAGYHLAFTTKPTYLTSENIKDKYMLPRFEVLKDVSFAENICRMSGVWFRKNNA